MAEKKRGAPVRRGAPKKDSNLKKSQIITMRITVDESIAIDRHIEKIGYKNRSRYLADLIRRDLCLWGCKNK